MDSDIVADYSPFLRIYKSGRIERLTGETTVSPSLTPQNGVVSKDVVYSPDDNLSLRLYLPSEKSTVVSGEENAKLPLLVYFHGGGFIIETAFSPTYHAFLTAAVSATDCIVVSVDYRRAPENPIPISYDDSWVALKWVFTHISGSGSEDWLNKHADFDRVYLAGDSAGANIAHHMAIRSSKKKLNPDLTATGIAGVALIHPYFWSKSPIDEKETRDEAIRLKIESLWSMASPNSVKGCDDPWINVVQSEPSDLASLGCDRVLVMVAEKDALARQGLCYVEKLKKSLWNGEVEVVESEGEDHVFHLMRPDCDKAVEAMERFSRFINGDFK